MRKRTLTAIRSNGVLPFKKICIHSHGLCYLFQKNLHLFAQLGLSVQKKFPRSTSSFVLPFQRLAAAHGRFGVFNADAIDFFGFTTTGTSFALVDD